MLQEEGWPILGLYLEEMDDHREGFSVHGCSDFFTFLWRATLIWGPSKTCGCAIHLVCQYPQESPLQNPGLADFCLQFSSFWLHLVCGSRKG